MTPVGTTANSITTLSFARYYSRNKHDLHECYNQLRHGSSDRALQTEPVRLGCSDTGENKARLNGAASYCSAIRALQAIS